MASEKWSDKMKRKNDLPFIQMDEVAIFLAGVVVFFRFHDFLFIFIISVLIWYWFKIRYYERLVVRKKREIYNVQYDNAEGVTLEFAKGRTAADREPMNYDLEQFETQRKFLVDKFVVVNLILLILLGL